MAGCVEIRVLWNCQVAQLKKYSVPRRGGHFVNPTIKQGEFFMIHDETLEEMLFEEFFAFCIGYLCNAMIQTLSERGGMAIKAVESD